MPTKKVTPKKVKVVAKEEVTAAPAGQYHYAVGRRKTAVARVRLFTTGTGEITINGKTCEQYFPLDVWQQKVVAPLKTAGMLKTSTLVVSVNGGGIPGQAEAVRHGVARAILKYQPETKTSLKAGGFLTRDPREKERKKYGLHKARRGQQWAKR